MLNSQTAICWQAASSGNASELTCRKGEANNSNEPDACAAQSTEGREWDYWQMSSGKGRRQTPSCTVREVRLAGGRKMSIGLRRCYRPDGGDRSFI